MRFSRGKYDTIFFLFLLIYALVERKVRAIPNGDFAGRVLSSSGTRSVGGGEKERATLMEYFLVSFEWKDCLDCGAGQERKDIVRWSSLNGDFLILLIVSSNNRIRSTSPTIILDDSGKKTKVQCYHSHYCIMTTSSVCTYISHIYIYFMNGGSCIKKILYFWLKKGDKVKLASKSCGPWLSVSFVHMIIIFVISCGGFISLRLYIFLHTQEEQWTDTVWNGWRSKGEAKLSKGNERRELQIQ